MFLFSFSDKDQSWILLKKKPDRPYFVAGCYNRIYMIKHLNKKKRHFVHLHEICSTMNMSIEQVIHDYISKSNIRFVFFLPSFDNDCLCFSQIVTWNRRKMKCLARKWEVKNLSTGKPIRTTNRYKNSFIVKFSAFHSRVSCHRSRIHYSSAGYSFLISVVTSILFLFKVGQLLFAHFL